MLNKLIDLERLTTFFQGLKDIFLQKSEASTTYATKTEVSNKVDKVEGKGLSTNDYSNTEKSKLDAIPSDPKYTDTIYTHPTNHSADMITESTTKRFVSDAEKNIWNSKQNNLGYTAENVNNKGVANGYAGLDNTGKVPSSQLPPIPTYDLSPYATTDYVDNKNTVKVLDTRDEAYDPLWYLDNHKSNIMYELKSKTVVGDITKATRAISVTSLSETTNNGIYVVGGMPNESYTTNNDYYMVATFIPLDQNGGYPMQILYSNPMAVRYGESNTLWGEWSTITTSDTEGVKTVLSFDDTTNDGIYVIGGQ